LPEESFAASLIVSEGYSVDAWLSRKLSGSGIAAKFGAGSEQVGQDYDDRAFRIS
jgi:hypothetical protein